MGGVSCFQMFLQVVYKWRDKWKRSLERLFKKTALGKEVFCSILKIQKCSILFWYIFWMLYFLAYFDTFLRWVFGILFGNTFWCICAHPCVPALTQLWECACVLVCVQFSLRTRDSCETWLFLLFLQLLSSCLYMLMKQSIIRLIIIDLRRVLPKHSYFYTFLKAVLMSECIRTS